MHGKTVLISGGSSGIGNSIANGLIAVGANVFVLSRRSPETWENPLPSSWKATTNWIKTDFTDMTRTCEVLGGWLNNHGDQLDVFIHSATDYGDNKRRPLQDISLETWANVFTVNTYSLFLITKMLLPFLLRKPEGLIIPITSDVAIIPGPGRLDYAASKAAALSFSRGLGEELNESSVRIVNLMPKNVINTPGIRNRRKPGTDFSSYVSPDSFIKAIKNLVSKMGKGLHNHTLAVDDNGNMNEISL